MPGHGPEFTEGDIRNLDSFVSQLQVTNGVSSYLMGQFTPKTKQLLQTYPTNSSAELSTLLIKELNKIITPVDEQSIFETQRFRDVIFSPETKALQRKKTTGKETIRFNRLLLEDAYPSEIMTSDEYSNVRRWFIASQLINAFGCIIAIFFIKAAEVGKIGNILCGLLGITAALQVVIIFTSNNVYYGHWPTTLSLIGYGIYIISDIVGWRKASTAEAKQSFQLPFFFSDLPAAVAVFILFLAVKGGATTFGFATGISAAITVLNNFSFVAVQGWLRTQR